MNSENRLILNVRKTRVHDAQKRDHGWFLTSDQGNHGPYEEVLLTIGQPQTAPDSQLLRWRDHADEHAIDLLPVYPANTFLQAAEQWADRSVAIRGLGLSTLDAIRLLTVGLGGAFKDGTYHPSGREPKRIMPFSLDGHPPFAKPSAAELDSLFNPNFAETRAFEEAMDATLAMAPDRALREICAALLSPVTRILRELDSPDSEADVSTWLETERTDPGTQENGDTLEVLKAGIEIAHGRALPTAGYIVGQIWRKWQNELRRGFNAYAHNIETALAIINFDEGLKRYSYGPPVNSAEELLVLIDAGIVKIHVADDPDVELIPAGWRLGQDDTASTVHVMIDAVIASPDLYQITDTLFSNLRDRGIVKAIAEGFGAHTQADGQVAGDSDTEANGLSLLGRLALGSVIAVDSLHDCFGQSSKRWAEGVVARWRANGVG